MSIENSHRSKNTRNTSEVNMAHKNASNWSPYSERQKVRNTKMGKHRTSQESFSPEEALDRLVDIFRNHGFEDYPLEKLKTLRDFYTVLVSEQKKINFTRLVNLKDIAIKHFIDCLMVPSIHNLRFPLLDMGTGAGFPGLPFAVHYQDNAESKIYLSEGVQKRVEFLKIARDKLKLQNVQIIGRNITADFHYPIETLVTRAVEDVLNTLEKAKGFLNSGGEVLFMKGPNCQAEIDQFLKSNNPFFELKKDIAYTLPSTPHHRRLLIFERTKAL